MKNLSKQFTLIPEKVDLIFNGKRQALCYRQGIINHFHQREKDLLDEVLDEMVRTQAEKRTQLLRELAETHHKYISLYGDKGRGATHFHQFAQKELAKELEEGKE